MAVVEKGTTAKLRLVDSKRKTLCTYSKVNPLVDPDKIVSFGNAINSLRNDTVGFKYLITESELKDEPAI